MGINEKTKKESAVFKIAIVIFASVAVIYLFYTGYEFGVWLKN